MDDLNSQSEKLTNWFFIYNANQQKLENCDESFLHFIKKDNLHKDGFDFLNTMPAYIRLFHNAYNICLDRRKSTIPNFRTTLKDGGEKKYLFDICATRLKPVNEGEALRILFIGKIVDEQSAKSKSSDLQVDELTTEDQAKILFDNKMQEFLYLALHDLNAPIRKLSMLLDRFSTKTKVNLTDDSISYITRMESVFNQLNTLMNSLSTLYEVSLQNNVLERCNLKDLLQEILVESEAILKSIDFSIHLPVLPNITGNPRQLKLLFQNIIHNAIVFKKENTSLKIELTSKLLSTKEKSVNNLTVDRSFYEFIIEDNGTGYEEHQAKIIFQPFRKLLGQKFPGSGLGLTICKKIVDNHSGIIYSEASQGVGAKITIILPEK